MMRQTETSNTTNRSNTLLLAQLVDSPIPARPMMSIIANKTRLIMIVIKNYILGNLSRHRRYRIAIKLTSAIA